MLLVQRQHHQHRPTRPTTRPRPAPRPPPRRRRPRRRPPPAPDRSRPPAPCADPSRSGSADRRGEAPGRPAATDRDLGHRRQQPGLPDPRGPRAPPPPARGPAGRCRHAHDSCRSSTSRPIIGTAESNIAGTALNVTNSGTGPVPSEDGDRERPHRLGQTLDLRGPPLGDRDLLHRPRQVGHPLRGQRLAGLGQRAQPGRQVQRPTAVAALDRHHLPGVQPDAHRQRQTRVQPGLVGEHLLQRHRRPQRGPRRGEHRQRLVTAQLQQPAAVRLDPLPRHPRELPRQLRRRLIPPRLGERRCSPGCRRSGTTTAPPKPPAHPPRPWPSWSSRDQRRHNGDCRAGPQMTLTRP